MFEFKDMIGKKRGYEDSTRIEIIKDIRRTWVDMSPEHGYLISYESGSEEGPKTKLELEWIQNNNLMKKYKCKGIEVEAMDEDYAWEMLFDLLTARYDARGYSRLDSIQEITKDLDTMEELGWS
jgi:hypothetical protein